MFNDLLQYIKQNHLIEDGDRILVAVSGGVDSMVLVHLLHLLPNQVAVAHGNFQLRGEESEKDQQLVEQFCDENNIQFFNKRFEVGDYATLHKVSVQMAARELRYQWFDHLVNKKGFDKVATAHHMDDNLETVLLNLIRGAGLEGILGIPMQRSYIIRPLLFTSKEQIFHFAQAEGIPWREDESNDSNKYARNLLRHEVIPILRQLNPKVEQSVARTSIYLKQVHHLFIEEMGNLRQQACALLGDNLEVHLDRIEGKIRQQAFLAYILREHHFNQFQIEDIFQNLEGVGAVYYSSSHQLNVDRKRLFLGPLDTKREYYEIWDFNEIFHTAAGEVHFREIVGDDFKISDSEDMALVDLDRLTLPLTLRTWAEGDNFIPLGMSGKKKLSDFMIDRKIPLNLKRHQLVLTSGDDIFWVVGHRISDPFKITPRTKRVLEIKLISHA